MDTLKSLKRLNNLIAKSDKFIFERDYTRAVRTLDGTYKTRTHNIDIYGNKIVYENNNSQWYSYEFENELQCQQWWNNTIRKIKSNI